MEGIYDRIVSNEIKLQSDSLTLKGDVKAMGFDLFQVFGPGCSGAGSWAGAGAAVETPR